MIETPTDSEQETPFPLCGDPQPQQTDQEFLDHQYKLIGRQKHEVDDDLDIPSTQESKEKCQIMIQMTNIDTKETDLHFFGQPLTNATHV